jgi:hypothetical protein
MLIQFSNDTLLPTGFLLSAVLRTDLVPVPVSLELEVRHDDELAKQLAEGQKIFVTGKAIELQIIKSQIKQSPQIPDRGMIQVTAVLSSCVAIGYRRQKAVILKSNSLGAIYKACGAKVSIKNDFTVPLFVSFLGQVPSEMIAKVLQEEAAVVRLSGKQLDCVRLADLMKQAPKLSLPQGFGEQIASGFLERHLVPSFYSTRDDRAIINGNTKKVRAIQYTPRHSERAANNMTSALITKQVLNLSYNDDYQAGDVFNIGGVAMAIITAAHVYETENEGDGGNQYTRLWLGELET